MKELYFSSCHEGLHLRRLQVEAEQGEPVGRFSMKPRFLTLSLATFPPLTLMVATEVK